MPTRVAPSIAPVAIPYVEYEEPDLDLVEYLSMLMREGLKVDLPEFELAWGFHEVDINRNPIWIL